MELWCFRTTWIMFVVRKLVCFVRRWKFPASVLVAQRQRSRHSPMANLQDKVSEFFHQAKRNAEASLMVSWRLCVIPVRRQTSIISPNLVGGHSCHFTLPGLHLPSDLQTSLSFSSVCQYFEHLQTGYVNGVASERVDWYCWDMILNGSMMLVVHDTTVWSCCCCRMMSSETELWTQHLTCELWILFLHFVSLSAVQFVCSK